jgi:hypothetical protein
MALFAMLNFWYWTQTISDWCRIKILKWTLVALLKADSSIPRGSSSRLKAQ